MSKTILTTGGIPTATTANVTQYWPLAVTSIEAPAAFPAEANKQILYRTPGTLSKLYVKVTANTINGTSTVNVRKNGNNAGLSLTIGPNATGAFENTVSTVSVAAGDRLGYQTVPGAATGTMSISILSVLFEATNTNETLTRLTTAGPALNYTTASVSRYNLIEGQQLSSNGSEINVKCRFRKAATGRNLVIYVSANARTSDCFVRTRKNATDGNCLITIPPGGTGWFEDTTNSDTLAVGDDYAVVVITGTGTEIMTVQSTSLDLVTTSGGAQTFNGRGAGFTVNAATTQYFPIGGAVNAGTTEVGAQQKIRMPAQFSELVVHVFNNTVLADSIVKVRKNGVDTSISTTIPASAVGYFSDSIHTETFTDTDDISLQLIAGATGTSLVIRSVSLALSETVAPVVPIVPQVPSIAPGRVRRVYLGRRIIEEPERKPRITIKRIEAGKSQPLLISSAHRLMLLDDQPGVTVEITGIISKPKRRVKITTKRTKLPASSQRPVTLEFQRLVIPLHLLSPVTVAFNSLAVLNASQIGLRMFDINKYDQRTERLQRLYKLLKITSYFESGQN